MNKVKLSNEEKNAELMKYRNLLIATLDYRLNNDLLKIQSPAFDDKEYFTSLKIQTEEHFKKGRLTLLKNWFRDLTEMQLETGDLKFNNYLQATTGYNVDIFKSYVQRIDKIVEKGKISSDRQYYDVNVFVGQLCQVEPPDNHKIKALNKLLVDYETRKRKSKRANE